ncbi:GntR family transcriptional regulator [Cohnella hashimotonis]|uniref:GntR family transcriptional regulator n=1 Tax=Cohnella hashimotonis TaxID=2826895 RepID=A0ABT6TLH6_9BACL|nr:GntR family transcriptional regulator [Cohnella hashimotonis]MDI4646662.1 GntR family transcriptional regulator [Cohnella hashimotonis]
MKPYQFKSQENLSLRQRVFADIRDAIVRGHLKPGDKLRELDIAKQMNVSRGPLREALRDLEALGLVVSSPYRETAVADVRKEEVVGLLIPVRLQLELFVLKQSRGKRDEAFFASLEEIVEEMKRASAEKDLFALVEADIRFHEQVLSLDESTHTQQIWLGIVNRLRLHFIKNTGAFGDLGRVPAEHAALVSALRSESDERIETLWTRHIRDEDCLLCFDEKTD